ncbi:MAG: hypothetical protein Unbinned465contig1000_35 [Prokaryotic dsDNA virus sp.]|nr:MAG: hypothetical protein Unbinned465contig1000_35 [Prokaryotic dsDNA virus sp.]|tara:strand:- start:4959 stop:5789 length:831 start_codon:yes stop_codon:yes gene_type:complete
MSKWNPSKVSTYYWANGSQVATNKGAPSIWTDQSGNGRVLQRPSQAAAPSLVSADLNGHDVLEFDGSNDIFVSDDASEFNFESSDFAIFCVHQRTGAGSSTNQSVYDMGSALSDAYSNVYVFLDGVIDSFFLMSVGVIATVTSGTTGVFCTAIVDNSTGAAFGRVDGQTAQTGGPDTSYTAGSPFTIGGAAAGSDHFDGKIAEIIVVQATLSDREIEQFEGYLLHKYDLDKYPDSHRFKRFEPAFGLVGTHNNSTQGEISLDISGDIASDGPAGVI